MDGPASTDEYTAVHVAISSIGGSGACRRSSGQSLSYPPRPRYDHPGGRRTPRHSSRDREVPAVICHRSRAALEADPRTPSSIRSTWHDHAARSRGPSFRLRGGRDRCPARSRVDAVLDEAHRTRQRVVLGPRRTPVMNSTFKVILAAAAVIALVVAGINFMLSR